MKTIGLIGGMSWESTAEYYRLINRGTRDRLGGLNNAKSVLVTVNFHDIEVHQRSGNWVELGLQMTLAAQQLAAAKADCVLICANTMHKLAPDVEAAVSIPLIHIVDATAAKIKQRGVRKVGLLGTRFTMEQDFYGQRLRDLHGIEVLIPGDDDRTIVHDAVYEELTRGILNDATRTEFQRIIISLKESGAEGVILGCTEFPLLVKPEDSALPTFDTTAIHAKAAVEFALASG